MTNQTTPKISNPCSQSWKKMTGTKEKRYCGDCQLHVHNLSEMTKSQREILLAQNTSRLCIAYEKDSSGALISYPDMNWFPRLKHRARSLLLALIAAILPFFMSACRTMGKMTKPTTTNEQTQNPSTENADVAPTKEETEEKKTTDKSEKKTDSQKEIISVGRLDV